MRKRLFILLFCFMETLFHVRTILIFNFASRDDLSDVLAELFAELGYSHFSESAGGEV